MPPLRRLVNQKSVAHVAANMQVTNLQQKTVSRAELLSGCASYGKTSTSVDRRCVVPTPETVRYAAIDASS
jgi:hypothetical protein